MSGIDPKLVVHKINVDPSLKLVLHKKRHLGTVRNQVVDHEVQKSLKSKFIRETHYS